VRSARSHSSDSTDRSKGGMCGIMFLNIAFYLQFYFLSLFHNIFIVFCVFKKKKNFFSELKNLRLNLRLKLSF